MEKEECQKTREEGHFCKPVPIVSKIDLSSDENCVPMAEKQVLTRRKQRKKTKIDTKDLLGEASQNIGLGTPSNILGYQYPTEALFIAERKEVRRGGKEVENNTATLPLPAENAREQEEQEDGVKDPQHQEGGSRFPLSSKRRHCEKEEEYKFRNPTWENL
ncbi:hypothetical protein H5410_056013 [Solanum commersonii]|uniref:Uncharacterized protein n=1 Tax=Solanum commersonii TaxID=4109 RepID=A0A9J5WKV2_SOLCO|nr:hypothetical protein H5410_056013 [Solanum commersonii]